MSTWHARLAHTYHTDIIALSKIPSIGVKVKDIRDKCVRALHIWKNGTSSIQIMNDRH
jgi:hypothetical protein